MIETYVKWCCDLEHVAYQRQSVNKLPNAYDYTKTSYKGLTITDSAKVKQMTIEDYVFGEIAI